MNPTLLLLLAGGAAIALGGKKKKPYKPSPPPELEPEIEGAFEEGVVDEGTAGPEAEPQYGDIVAKGVRRDKRGAHAWRIKFEEDGYHIQLMMGAFRAAPVSEELGITATMRAGKELIRDIMNERLLAAGYKEEDLREDPVRKPITVTDALRARS